MLVEPCEAPEGFAFETSPAARASPTAVDAAAHVDAEAEGEAVVDASMDPLSAVEGRRGSKMLGSGKTAGSSSLEGSGLDGQVMEEVRTLAPSEADGGTECIDGGLTPLPTAWLPTTAPPVPSARSALSTAAAPPYAGGLGALCAAYRRADASTRQRQAALWAARMSTDKWLARRKAERAAQQTVSGGNRGLASFDMPSFQHELATDPVGFAFGGVHPGNLHSRGRLVKVHQVRSRECARVVMASAWSTSSHGHKLLITTSPRLAQPYAHRVPDDMSTHAFAALPTCLNSHFRSPGSLLDWAGGTLQAAHWTTPAGGRAARQSFSPARGAR